MAMATVPHAGDGQRPASSGGEGNGTPVKRTHGSGSFPASAKRQRSFRNSPTEEKTQELKLISSTRAEGNAMDGKPFASSATTAPKLDHVRHSSSPGALKSSLKLTGNTLAAGLDSPSESDKRGMYYDYVQNALLDRARGRDAGYQELVAQFNLPSRTSSSAPPPLGLLQMLLHALTGVASKLDRRNHSPLVNAILVLPWATMGGDAFARTWTRFVCTLCSARSEWVSEVLSRAVKGLSYRSDWRSMAYAPATSSSKPTRRHIYARIHVLLRSLLSLIPTLPTQLAPLILRHFPHKGEGIREHVVFVQNAFEMCEYAEELRPSVLEFVIARSLEIDVEIQIELDELEDAEAEFDEGASDDGGMDLRGTQKEMSSDLLDKPLDDDSDSDDDGESDDGAGLDDLDSDGEGNFDDLARGRSQSERERMVQVRQLVDKLDAVMSTLFSNMEVVDSRYAQASKGLTAHLNITPGRAITMRNEQFGNLMRIFERTLLPTFKSRHVQFLLFWFASLERNFSDQFVGMLLSKAIYARGSQGHGEEAGWHAQNSPTVMRVAASSYIASLVSRAKFIDAKDARIVMLNLCAFLDAHLNAYNPRDREHQAPTAADSDALGGPHAIFYAVAQACFYIFCFRWRDLQSGGEDGDEGDEDAGGNGAVRWCHGMEAIKRAILSPLNPLAHCSATVVRQFAGVAQLTGYLYCWNVIERNSRSGGKRHDGASTPTLSRTNSLSSLSSPPPRSNSALPSTMVNVPATPGAVSPRSTMPTSDRPEIDSFFPFDPYRLRGSTKWVEPIYREWCDVAPEGMIDDSDDDDEEEEEEEEEEESVEDDDEDAKSDVSSGSPTNAVVAPSSNRRNGLSIPNALQHKPVKPSKLSNAHTRQSFGASASTDESSSMAQSLEAMSISPRFV